MKRHNFIIYTQDNRVCNLEFVTHTEKIKHSYGNGVKISKNGMQHHNAKLSKDDVLKIREMRSSGKYLLKDIADELEFNYSSVPRTYKNNSCPHF
ncbi:MAG: hypothetical protein N4A71_07995 [Carboxylicivirga sp.]|nr:hypothetical protein [Carboxylicivirga sp.]